MAIGNIAALLDPLSFLKKFQELDVATIPPLSSEEALTIGRLPDCELVIDDPSVSKHHARISWKSAASLAILEDLDSSNGTLLNNKKLAGPTVLKDNDLLSVGNVTLCFLFSGTLYAKLR
jgi:pSer/pThr/pTyr-binding forkhead associated (FHA) protein